MKLLNNSVSYIVLLSIFQKPLYLRNGKNFRLHPFNHIRFWFSFYFHIGGDLEVYASDVSNYYF